MFLAFGELVLDILVAWIKMITTPLSQVQEQNLFLRYQLQLVNRQNKTAPQYKPIDRALFSTLGNQIDDLKIAVLFSIQKDLLPVTSNW